MEAVLTSSQEKEVNNNQTVKEGETLATPRTVTVTDPEEWICVAKLPPDTDQQAFQHLLADFGTVKDSFLQKSPKTGEFFRQFCLVPSLSVRVTTQYSTVSFSPSLPLSLCRSIFCLRAEHRAHMLVTLILLTPSAPRATAR